MKKNIEQKIKEVLKNLGVKENVSFNIEHPEDLKNGDYSTNVAMVYAKNLKTNPKELAEKIKQELEKNLPKEILKVEVAGPGFINFYLSREFFTNSIKEILEKGDDWGKNEILSGKKVMVEYTDPNPFKPFHIGHLMANAIGESISRIVEYSGAETVRANYQGDVGPHVAKAVYHLIELDYPINNSGVSYLTLALAIGNSYAQGNHEYEINDNVKKRIDNINKQIYNYINKNGACDEKIKEYYDWGKRITLEAFEEIYSILGTKFDKYYLESVMAPIGEKIVRENTGDIFEESDGAIVFKAEKCDSKLHTRVFINSQGLPTYETKEIGLAMTKFEEVKDLDISIVTTAIEQAEYMKVVQKAISLIHPELEKKMKHITHGMMKLTTGKMSSRKGNIITGESLISDSVGMVKEKIKDREFENNERLDIANKVGVSALKYSILKSSIGSDIIYDQEKSISFNGDSGPYLQYTAVRANSILEKSKNFDLSNKNEIPDDVTNLEKKIYQFGEIVEYSYKELEPHHIATYLTELASEFNSFYGNIQILKDDNVYMKYHLDLIKAFYQTMKNGLWLLGIEIPEKM